MDRLDKIRERCERAKREEYSEKVYGSAAYYCITEDIPFLLAEVERLNKFADAYAPSSRIVALYLAKFCNGSLPYAEMIADAARRADSEITALTARAEKAEHERDEAHEKGFEAGQNNMLEAGYVLKGE